MAVAEVIVVPPTPLKVTPLLAGVAEKPVPVIVTDADPDPLVGVKPLIVGGRVKLLLEYPTGPPLTLTPIRPVDALLGTVAMSCMDVALATVAAAPLKVTLLLAAVASKPVPVIVTAAPIAPVVGEKLVIVGSGMTVKVALLVAVAPLTVTEILPDVAPPGTVAINCVVLADVTLAAAPLNWTVFLEAVELKCAPVIVTDFPIAAVVGVKLVIVGAVAQAGAAACNDHANMKKSAMLRPALKHLEMRRARRLTNMTSLPVRKVPALLNSRTQKDRFIIAPNPNSCRGLPLPISQPRTLPARRYRPPIALAA